MSKLIEKHLAEVEELLQEDTLGELFGGAMRAVDNAVGGIGNAPKSGDQIVFLDQNNKEIMVGKISSIGRTLKGELSYNVKKNLAVSPRDRLYRWQIDINKTKIKPDKTLIINLNFIVVE